MIPCEAPPRELGIEQTQAISPTLHLLIVCQLPQEHLELLEELRQMQTRPAVVFTKTRTRTPTLTLSPILRPETIRALVLSKTHAPNKTEPAPALLITITAPISSKIHATSKIGLVKMLTTTQALTSSKTLEDSKIGLVKMLTTTQALTSSKTLEDNKTGQAKISHGMIMAPATVNLLALTTMVNHLASTKMANALALTKMVPDSLTATQAHNMPTMPSNIRTFSIHTAILPNG